jgi:outer membrane biosynthesis protein TonB
VRREVDSLSTEIGERGAAVEVPPEAVTEEPQVETPAPPEPEPTPPEPEPEPEPEPTPPEPEPTPPPEPAAAEETQVREEQPAEEPAPVQEPPAEERPAAAMGGEPAVAAAPQEPTRRRRGLLRRMVQPRASRLFVSEPGQCAVCNRTLMAGSEEALQSSGWRVSGDVGLCPQCQSEGWQLPEGARLPFRRGGG